VATSAIARTWFVRLAASRFTLPVRSFPCAGCARHVGLAAEPAVHADFARDVGDLLGKVASVSVMLLIVSASAATSPLASTVRRWRRLPSATAVTTLTMPRTWLVRFAAMRLTESVRSFHVPATSETCACPPSLAVGADFARHARDFRRERPQLIDHRVDGVLQLEDFAFHVDGDLAREVATRDGGGDLWRCCGPAR
jgi:hypothetical protein